jgi:hypothetical protein
VDDFKKASDLRKNADGVQRQIDLAKSQLTPKEQDLALVKAQSETIGKTVTQLEQERAALAAQWDALQKQIQDQRQNSQRYFKDEAGKGQDTIAAQLVQLNTGLADVQKMREQAVAYLTQASAGFTEAANAAQNVQNGLRSQSGGAESEAQKTMQSVIDPQNYQLQKVAVMASVAQVKASEAAELQHRLELSAYLSPLIQGAGLAAPAELGDAAELKGKVEAAQKDADKAFADAEQMFKQLGGSAGRSGATVLHIVMLYNWSQLAAGAGDAKNATARLAAAKALADNAAKNNVALPPLPPEVTPSPAAAAPTTKPA